MTRAVTRTHFHNSQLIRILTDLSVIEMTEPAKEFAEKLGQWVGFADAIGLHGIHNAGAVDLSRTKSAVALVSTAKPDDEFAKVQAKLEASIRTSFASNADLFGDETITYAPFRKFYLAHQRDMALNVRKLRIKARARLADASGALKQLATLDAAFEGILVEREKKLLATLPPLMERRFQQLQAERPRPEGWLACFGQELQTVLLAELDLRLQPTLGLIEAFNEQTTSHA
jgi:Protein of unknown function (DUF3348)